jgi:hypothetical protein
MLDGAAANPPPHPHAPPNTWGFFYAMLLMLNYLRIFVHSNSELVKITQKNF